MVKKMLVGLFTNKEYTLLDTIRYFKGLSFSMNSLQEEMRKMDLTKYVSEVEIPIYFLMEKYDLTVPYEPTKAFFNNMKASEKHWIWFEHSAHTPMLEEKEKFVQVLVQAIEQDNSAKLEKSK